MFGHDDQSQHQDGSQPAQDADLVNDQGMSMPAVVDENAGDFMDGAPDAPAVAQPAAPAAAAPAVGRGDNGTANDDLLDIKQQALQQLTPLIGHLDQSPEEKFRTTMMMIQASDNDGLLRTAYEAAQAIPDEKVRAQALLDIVNEINYFTHNSNGAEA